MLKLALDYEQLTFSGKTPHAAIAMVKSNGENYGSKLLQAFSRIVGSQSTHEGDRVEIEPTHKGVRELRAGELTPGMIIAKDIFTKKGILLIKADTEVNLVVYETLHNFAKTDFVEEPFQVLIP